MKYIRQYGALDVLWASETIFPPGAAAQVDLVFLDLLDVSSNKFGVSEGISEFAAHFANIIITTAYPVEYIQRTGLPHSQLLIKPYTYPDFEAAVTAALRRP
ncbi:hypothetical protein GCM10027422_23990 [Hymenobacter arcticus]